MTKPKIIFIDWYNTLSKSKFWESLKNSSKENQELYKLISNNLFETNIDLLEPWMRGSLTSEDIIEKISTETKVDFKKIYKEFIKSCKSMEFVSPNIPKLVKDLQKKGSKVYIATDNMDSFDRWTTPSMKLTKIFDGIINSYQIKCLKFDFDREGKSLFFNDFLVKEKIRPQETILIDDKEDVGNRVSSYGVNYMRVSKTNTLETTLRKLLG